MFTDGQIVIVLPVLKNRAGNDFAGSSDVVRLADFVYKIEVINGHTYLRCLKDRYEEGKSFEVREVID